MVKPFALVLNLVLSAFKTGLGTLPCPFLSHRLHCMLLILLFKCAQGLVSLDVEIGLNSDLILGVFNPFFSYKNLLDSLHINNKGVR